MEHEKLLQYLKKAKKSKILPSSTPGFMPEKAAANVIRRHMEFFPRINWPSHHEQLANTHHSTSVREDSKAMALVRPIPLSCDINNFASDRIPLVLVPTTAPVN